MIRFRNDLPGIIAVPVFLVRAASIVALFFILHIAAWPVFIFGGVQCHKEFLDEIFND